MLPTALMLIATVFSLAYSLRFISKVFLGQSKEEQGIEITPPVSTQDGVELVQAAEEAGIGHKILDVPNYMKLSLGILVVLVVLIGIYPTFFMNLIQSVSFGGV
jgi:NADH-quinone oxidoreductase subunit M